MEIMPDFHANRAVTGNEVVGLVAGQAGTTGARRAGHPTGVFADWVQPKIQRRMAGPVSA